MSTPASFISLADRSTNVFNWSLVDVRKYFDELKAKMRAEAPQAAEQSPDEQNRNAILEDVWGIIEECLFAGRSYAVMRVQENGKTVELPKCIRAQERLGSFIDITNFYDALGFVICAIDTDVHRDARHEAWALLMLKKYARICALVYRDHFAQAAVARVGNSMAKSTKLPTCAMVLWGPMAGEQIMTVPHIKPDEYAISMSCSLPGDASGTAKGKAAKEETSLKTRACVVRREDLFEQFAQLRNYNPFKKWEYGNCAETNTFISRFGGPRVEGYAVNLTAFTKDSQEDADMDEVKMTMCGNCLQVCACGDQEVRDAADDREYWNKEKAPKPVEGKPVPEWCRNALYVSLPTPQLREAAARAARAVAGAASAVVSAGSGAGQALASAAQAAVPGPSRPAAGSSSTRPARGTSRTQGR
ncbi:hypothetical protein PsYK624_099320 [Phanerochaete sordida]|uniref:Uncharacterized protein n=1 Tax=Phanerochaete sordida TaxID=48140 RepID=A0A9P3GF43_9APHY|nr:hypothetical protein PsYK624_099320 [Phanerochaete sordida]